MQSSETSQDSQPESWSHPKPEVLAAPTWWPAGLAFGSTLLAWGLVTSWIIVVIGAGVFGLSLGGWIRDIRLEQKETAYGSERKDNDE